MCIELYLSGDITPEFDEGGAWTRNNRTSSRHLPREEIIEFRAPSFAEKDHEGGLRVDILGGSGRILARSALVVAAVQVSPSQTRNRTEYRPPGHRQGCAAERGRDAKGHLPL